MSLTPTKQIELGFQMPNFSLPDTITGRIISNNEIKGEKGTLVMFICNHCPYVLHVIHQLIKIGYDYKDKGIGFVAISSNDVVNYPQDHPDRMKEFGLSLKFPFPYLYDESQEVAKAYDAVCTPDFDLFDEKGNCVYRGQLDGSRPGNNVKVDGKDLRFAIEQVLTGEEITQKQIPSTGCNIKWK